ncbi:hypothetical protein VTK73DRAFT_6017 [Phialemonium thermophilum]|uniref:Uncharacterized protein n=1 Tax=Phialemonium thermophilum TaxID=223376 RepID=A0ABR3WL28_9PEZI
MRFLSSIQMSGCDFFITKKVITSGGYLVFLTVSTNLKEASHRQRSSLCVGVVLAKRIFTVFTAMARACSRIHMSRGDWRRLIFHLGGTPNKQKESRT